MLKLYLTPFSLDKDVSNLSLLSKFTSSVQKVVSRVQNLQRNVQLKLNSHTVITA